MTRSLPGAHSCQDRGEGSEGRASGVKWAARGDCSMGRKAKCGQRC